MLIEPLIVSWGYRSLIPGRSRFIDLLQWTGTRDISSWLSVPAAIDFQSLHNWEQVRSDCHQLASETSIAINKMTHLPAIHEESDTWFGQMASMRIPDDVDITSLKSILYERYRIEIPLFDWGGLKLIRVSYQGYNTRKDMKTLLDALDAEL
jgi:isopenicillin-N epimerase